MFNLVENEGKATTDSGEPNKVKEKNKAIQLLEQNLKKAKAEANTKKNELQQAQSKNKKLTSDNAMLKNTINQLQSNIK